MTSVLVADRDPDQRLLVRLALSTTAGFDVVAEAGDGHRAVEALLRHRPDLVLLDVDLPGRDGFEVIAVHRRELPGSVAIVLSSHPDGRPPRGGDGAGAVGHLARSLSPLRLPGEIVQLSAVLRAVDQLMAATTTVEAATTAARTARRFADEVLGGWGCAPLLDTVQLLVSELVTNAVVHARSEAEVGIRLSANAVRVEVTDHSEALPVRRVPAPEQPGGRGIALVEQMARSWGIELLDVGKRIWFEIDRSPGTSDRPGPEA